jgi:uncharacterized damage-inducible protein DinB
MTGLILMLTMAAWAAPAQTVVGFHDEYLEELRGASKELTMLAEAMPADKYGWRPGPGVRSVSEVYVHVAASDFMLLAMVGKPLPNAYYPNAGVHPAAQQMYRWGVELEHKVTARADVVRMLDEAVAAAERDFQAAGEVELNRPAEFFGEKTTVRRIYLRILAHTDEHLGQSIAYARVNGVVPPWSMPKKK